jgi:hypothetical protein
MYQDAEPRLRIYGFLDALNIKANRMMMVIMVTSTLFRTERFNIITEQDILHKAKETVIRIIIPSLWCIH